MKINSRSICIIVSIVLFACVVFPAAPASSKVYAASYFQASNVTKPDMISQGSGFYLKGTITGTNKIKSIRVGITNTSGSWLKGFNVKSKPNSKTFDLSTVDSKIKFGSLSVGIYKYRVYAVDDKDNKKNVVNYQFAVVGKYKVKIKDLTKPGKIKAGSSFSLRGKVTSTNAIAEITVGVVDSSGEKWVNNCKVTQTPWTNSFDISSVDSKIKFGKLKAGKYYYRVRVKDLTGKAKNNVNEKFTVTGKDGSVADVTKSTEESGSSSSSKNKTGTSSGKSENGTQASADRARENFSISGVTKPENGLTGKSFSLKGKVSCKVKIKSIRIGITNSKGSWKSGFNVTKKPNKKSFDINSVDSLIKFGQLGAGTYYYKVYGTDKNGDSVYLVEKKFKLYKTTSIKIADASKPKDMKMGESFSLKGKVTSENPLSYVKVGIATEDSGSWKKDFYKKIKTTEKSFDISTVDSNIKFSKLPAGTYWYRVYAKDASNSAKTLVNEEFEVKDPNAKEEPQGKTKNTNKTVTKQENIVTKSSKYFYLTPNRSYPSILVKGEGFDIRGTVSAGNKLKTVKVGVADSSGKYMSKYSVTKSLSSKTYNLSNVNDSIKFGKLKVGNYYYMIYAKDSKGNAATLLKAKFCVIHPPVIDTKSKASNISSKKRNKMDEKGCLTQVWYAGGCTVTSVAMMLKRKLILSGEPSHEYDYIYESRMRSNPVLWLYGSGMTWSGTFAGMTFQQKSLTGSTASKKKKLKKLLEKHPEGIAVYNSRQPHAILLTRYSDGVFYTCDPVYGQIRTLSNTSIRGGGQDGKISGMTYYWEITN